MLSEDDLQRRLHSELGPLLAPVQPGDLVTAIRRRQQRRTNMLAAVAVTISVLAITMPFVAKSLGDNRTARIVATPTPTISPQPTATTTTMPNVLVSTGECAGLTVTLQTLGAPAPTAVPLSPYPADNKTTMSYAEVRYLEGTGPCVNRVRVHTEGGYLQGALYGFDDNLDDDGAPLFAKAQDTGGVQKVELFLDCPDGPCPSGDAQPIAVIVVEVLPHPEGQADDPSMELSPEKSGQRSS